MKSERDKFFELLAGIMKDLEKFSIYLLRNRDTARDLLSDTILDGYASFGSIRNEKSFKSFMFTIMRRRSYDYFRHNKRFLMTDPQVFDELFCTQINPEDSADLNLLFEKVENLESDKKEAFIMAEILGMKHKEIADIQNTSIANIKVRVFRAKRELEKMLGIDNVNVNKNDRRFIEVENEKA
jgi:RNA polymerase sigma-70 factor (ECF subfamily)